jgi:hypothetical protein
MIYGHKGNQPTPLFMDTFGVVLNASNPGNTLNKKLVGLSYHFVREHVANHVTEIRKIDSNDNYPDLFIKALNSNGHHDCLNEE